MEIWWIILIAVIIIALLSIILAVGNFAGEKFNDMYKKMFSMQANVPKTVLEVINEQNFECFSGKLKLARTKRKANDSYNSKHKMLVLSDETLASNSVGAFTIVAHELGHALQDLEGKKLKAMNVLHAIGWIVGKFFLPAVIATIVLIFFENLTTYAIITGAVAAAIFVFAVIIKLITISIEKDASKRALQILDEFMPDDQLKEAKKFLSSARLTYWSDLVRLLFGWSGLVKRTKMFK